MDPYKGVTLDNSIQFALMAGAFTSGTGDYVTLFEPTASMLEAEGKGYIVASIGKESGEIPYTAYFAKKSYIEKHADLIERFTRAVYKGSSGWPPTPPGRWPKSWLLPSRIPASSCSPPWCSGYKDIDAWSADPVLKESSFRLLQEVMTQAGELKQAAPYGKVVNTAFAEKVKAQ